MPAALFERFGVEIEHMIVARDSPELAVLPIADRLLAAAAGEPTGEFENGPITWSNELALHVVELKVTEPASSLAPLPEKFHASALRMIALLEPLGARLLPTGMHPFMVPERDMRLWPHDCAPVYAAFDRIFSCRGHGWANLQSVHLNLPFSGDDEFARLHAAIRLLLPILPALAASTPFKEGRATGLLDTRLETYRTNARAVPSVTGRVVPEPVRSRDEYEEKILGPIYADMAPLDPEGILRHEWVNARGAIARFERDTIEIRVLDSQECPSADVAVVAAVVAVLRRLVAGEWAAPESIARFPGEPLETLFLETIREADRAVVRDGGYLSALGRRERGPVTAGELWRDLADRTLAKEEDGRAFLPHLRRITTEGPLARRILRRAGRGATRESIAAVYRDLARCLEENRPLEAAPGGP